MRWILPLLAALVLTGCTAPAAPSAPPHLTPSAPSAPPQLPPPAEPATAPPLTGTPAGRTVPVGAGAEGIVADPVTHLVAVGVRDPFAVVLLDGTTGEVRTRTPLPGQLRHLQLQAPGGPVLVPDEGAGELLRVALPSGIVASRVPTGRVPHDATAAADGSVVVSNELGATVSVIRGTQVVHTFTDVVQPAGLAPVGTLVGLLDVRKNTLTVYDAAALRTVGEVPAGNGPTHVVADARGHLDVVDTRGGAVLVYALDPAPRQIAALALPGRPYGVSYDPVRDRLWVTLTERNELVELDLSSGGQPREVLRLPTVRQPNTVAVDSATGRVFVAGADAGVVELVDPPA